ncbi:SDR family NAD(P)-dependent oxidoreductase [Pusillimonas sp. NJUB218]|uniref:SDR family NAD(P)-dependent oxidoreductase n=1 Tax=Pusillimonas sp. NJUB218 TaxID=2023230 RepID=UPI000F4BBFFF|nr:SDR family oxidoreductase [Pusillimonas sp. NJUB218]ROT46714.1 hypothetical protein CHR62_01980 [Pusillimonas sp. NJUB218]
MSIGTALKGKVCVVTGGANGLGAAIAKGFVSEGACVVIADLDAAGLERVVQSVDTLLPGHIAACLADITKDQDAEQIVATAMKVFGGLDVVVNNAGTGAQIIRPDFISRPLNVWEIPPEKWRRIMDVNAIGPFLLSRAAIPLMLQRGGGRLINVSTTWETMLRPGFASYGPSKAALESMSAAMATELKSHGITVNTVIPGGPVDTAQVPEDIGVPREKLLQPDVMVPVMNWLASDDSSHVTSTRLTAAYWHANRSVQENMDEASEPVAWPQLVKTIVMSERGNLS